MDYDQFAFATGDLAYFIIAKQSEIIGKQYDAERIEFIISSQSNLLNTLSVGV